MPLPLMSRLWPKIPGFGDIFFVVLSLKILPTYFASSICKFTFHHFRMHHMMHLCSVFPIGDGSIQLWIFLLDLLLSPDYRHIIHWTGNMYEFRIAQPAGLAKLWGSHRNKPQMTYEKMSRALRYYYSRGIIESVRGRKQTFRFSLDLQKYVSSNKDKKCLDYLKSCCHL